MSEFDLTATLSQLATLRAEKARVTAPLDAKIAELESEIVSNTRLKHEGSTTLRGGALKATVTTRINRTIDKKAEIPASVSDCFKYEPKLEIKHYRVAMEDPDLALLLSEIVTEKEGKPSIKLEVVN